MRDICKEMRQILDERIVSKMKFKLLILFVVAALAALLYPPLVSATSILGSAENFAVLGGQAVTNTGSTTITGDVGVYPGSAITGFPPGLVTGTIHGPGAVSLQAQSDVTTAYTGLAAMPYNSVLTGKDLGGLTLTSGVYKFDSAAQLTGSLTLDAQHNNNAYWVFQIGSALTTAPGSSVVLTNLGTNDGRDNGLYWQVGSSATLGTTTAFEGNILALTSITMNTGATIPNGRALARNGAVTLDANAISPGYSGGLEFDTAGHVVPVPVPAAMLLLGSGLAGLAAFRKRFKKAGLIRPNQA
ncbi:MAG: ice-binding family protein [Anaerolineales bacterium]|nr:ice-binding family protein [Anaerolineales bacterium]